MNDIKLYERIADSDSIRIHYFKNKKYRFLPHWHEHIELHLILQGSFVLRCGEEQVLLQCGDCAVINGNELHGGGGGDGTYICILIPPCFLNGHTTLFRRCVRDEQIADLIRKIADLREDVSAATQMQIKGYVYFLLSQMIARYALHSDEKAAYSQSVNRLEKLEPALRLIHQSYDQPISTRRLAELVHLSEGYFCQIFKEATGKSAMDYLNELRVDRAEEHLKNTNATVGEIAYCCGFTDTNYFSRTFKKIKGVTPGSLRDTKGAEL